MQQTLLRFAEQHSDNPAEFATVIKPYVSYINAPDRVSGQTVLHCSARYSAKVLCILLKNGGDPNIKDYNGCSPFRLAANGDKIKLHLMLKYGAVINSVDNDCQSALTGAIISGNVDNVRFLLRCGADHKLVSRGFRTQLSFARDPSIIQMLKNAHSIIVQPISFNPPSTSKPCDMLIAVWPKLSTSAKIEIIEAICPDDTKKLLHLLGPSF